ncbi:hypothetical protein O0L34_g19313 [Tuta absoluta]|nr:hypothetical protein O0L34_g19313 [Tuta absoluta]
MAKRSPEVNLSSVVMKLSAISGQLSDQSALITVQNTKIEKQNLIINGQHKIIGDQQRVIIELSDKVDKLIGLMSATRVSETANPTSKESASTVPTEPVLSERARRAAARANKPPQQNSNKRLQQNTCIANNEIPNSIHLESATHVPTGNESADRDWQVQTSKRSKKKRRSVLVGAGATNDKLQTVEKQRHIQIWQLKPDTTVENIQNFLNTIVKSDGYEVKKRNIKSTRHACFIIALPESIYDAISSPSVWPAGVCISDWFLYRPRAQRGA